MTETASAPPVVGPTRSRWQVRVRSLALLVLAIAVWLGVIRNWEQTRGMESRLNVLRALTRELEVDDPSQIAVVRKLDEWISEERWDLYLPPGSYRICMSTDQIGTTGLPPVVKSLPIAPGRHRLALDQRTENHSWKAVVSWDGSERLTIEKPREFCGDGSSSANDITVSEQQPGNQPLVLSRSTFSDSSSTAPVNPGSPSNGLMIWIEPTPGKTPAR